MALELKFSTNETDEDEGLNDPGIETFRHAPYESLARECGQNSADACVKQPVELSFKLISVPRGEVPAEKQLQATLKACLSSVAGDPKKKKECEFLERAVALMNKESVDILVVSDENTKGLVGPAKAGTPFHALVKSTGVSNKEAVDSTGSFGIGKNAAFAASDLRTVFYSTRFQAKQGQPLEFLAQGKSILMSHNGPDGRPRRRVGFWGEGGFEAINDPRRVPAWMRRDKVGASIFVAGFHVEPRWEKRIVVTVLNNFFFAIHNREMVVKVGDEFEISAAKLQVLFNDKELAEVAEEFGAAEDLKFAADAYRALLSSETTRREVLIETLGKVEISVLLNDEFPKRVMFIRNGMKITDNLLHFGDRLARFPNYRPFVAYVRPLTVPGSALLKDMENPQHNEFSHERISDDARKALANTAMRALSKRIREAIKTVAVSEPADVIALDELSEFLADLDPKTPPKQSGTETDPEKLNWEPHSPRDSKTVQTKDAPGNTGGGSKRTGKRGKKGKRSRGGSQKGKGPGSGSRAIKDELLIVEARNILASPTKRKLFFTPQSSGIGRLVVSASGVARAERLPIVATTNGTVAKGDVEIEFEQGVRFSLEIEFSEPYEGPLELALRRVETP